MKTAEILDVCFACQLSAATKLWAVGSSRTRLLLHFTLDEHNPRRPYHSTDTVCHPIYGFNGGYVPFFLFSFFFGPIMLTPKEDDFPTPRELPQNKNPSQ